ncbi:MAG: hypothetical protein QOJ78_2748, partial [Pseudonocardiales bacterium]|nr:hypothetical protein [Pseudonocardiales bacterium]
MAQESAPAGTGREGKDMTTQSILGKQV